MFLLGILSQSIAKIFKAVREYDLFIATYGGIMGLKTTENSVERFSSESVGNINNFSFSENGSVVGVSYWDYYGVYDMDSKGGISNYRSVEFQGGVRHCVVSPDGKKLAACISSAPFLKVHLIATDGLSETLSLSQNPTAMVANAAWSPDGTYLTVTTVGSILLYKVIGSSLTLLQTITEFNGKSFTYLPTISGGYGGTKWAPAGNALCYHGYLQNGAYTAPVVALFSFSNEQLSAGSGPFDSSQIPVVAWSPKSNFVIYTKPSGKAFGFIQTYHGSGGVTGNVVDDFNSTITSLDISADGSMIAAGTGNMSAPLNIYKMDLTGHSPQFLSPPQLVSGNVTSYQGCWYVKFRPVRQYLPSTEASSKLLIGYQQGPGIGDCAFNNGVTETATIYGTYWNSGLACSSDGKVMVTWTQGEILVFDRASDETLTQRTTFSPQCAQPTSIKINHDGSKIFIRAKSSGDAGLNVYSLDGTTPTKLTVDVPPASKVGLGFSFLAELTPDEKYFVTSQDADLLVYSVTDSGLTLINTVNIAPSSSVLILSGRFNPKGDRLVVNLGTGIDRIYSFDTGALELKFGEGNSPAFNRYRGTDHNIAWSPNGTYIAAISYNGDIGINYFDNDTMRVVDVTALNASVQLETALAIAFSNDSKYLALAGNFMSGNAKVGIFNFEDEACSLVGLLNQEGALYSSSEARTLAFLAPIV